MAVTPTEAMAFEHTATDAELGAYCAAWDAAQEQEPHPERYRDLFLVLVHAHPRRVPVVAVIGVNPDGTEALDGVWCFLPGRAAALWTNRGEVFDLTAEAVRVDRVAASLGFRELAA